MLVYIITDIIISMNIPLITRLKLNTCEPYNIRYPIPFFDTKNSPIITPLSPPVREN